MMIHLSAFPGRKITQYISSALFFGIILISSCNNPAKEESMEGDIVDTTIKETPILAAPPDTGTQDNEQREEPEKIVAKEEQAKPAAKEKKAPVVEEEKKKIEVKKSPASLAGVKWKLIELAGKPIQQEDIKNQVLYIMFDSTEKRVYGFGGCNQFFGEYALEETLQIDFKKMTTTMMACDRMELESQFISIFEDVDNYSMSQNNLSLNKAKMAPLARFEVSK